MAGIAAGSARPGLGEADQQLAKVESDREQGAEAPVDDDDRSRLVGREQQCSAGSRLPCV